MESDRKVAVCHLVSGDLWAGAEAQVYTMIEALRDVSSLEMSAIVLNRGKLATKLSELGIRTTVIDESRHSFREIIRLAGMTLEKSHVDILHSHRYKENILAALLKKKSGIKALVQTVHGIQEGFTGLKSFKMWFYGSINRILSARKFDLLLPVSNDICSRLSAVYEVKKLRVVPNAVNISKITPQASTSSIRQGLGTTDSDFIVGAVGRLAPVKGFEIFIQVAREVAQKRPRAKFILVGDGPEQAKLRRLCVESGLETTVIFAGFRDDIIDVVNTFDIFLMTSWHEGIPISLLEAMALRKAVVSTGVGGVNEVITNGASGKLLPAGDVAGLASACIELIDSEPDRRRLADSAFKRVSAEYSDEILRERLTAIYLGLMNN